MSHYHGFRCTQCSLMRCDAANQVCAECQAHAAAPKRAQPAPTSQTPTADQVKAFRDAMGKQANPQISGNGNGALVFTIPGAQQNPEDPADCKRLRWLFKRYQTTLGISDIGRWRADIDRNMQSEGFQ